MSTQLAIGNPGTGSRQVCVNAAPRLDRASLMKHSRAAIFTVVLIALAAMGERLMLAEGAGPTAQHDSAAGHARSEATPTASSVGTFSGTYRDGMPVYTFPPILVTGSRTVE